MVDVLAAFAALPRPPCDQRAAIVALSAAEFPNTLALFAPCSSATAFRSSATDPYPDTRAETMSDPKVLVENKLKVYSSVRLGIAYDTGHGSMAQNVDLANAWCPHIFDRPTIKGSHLR